MKKSRKSAAKAKLRSLIARSEELKSCGRNSPAFMKWVRSTELALNSIFGETSKNVGEFKSLSFSPSIFTVGGGNMQFERAFLRGLEESKALLESMLEEIDEYWDNDGITIHSTRQKALSSGAASKNVFIVHGRAEGPKETLARFVSSLGYNPIILHEQPSGGKTVIEKFEKNADACFAIALLTPDDMGGLVGQGELRPRARQNVIFEFGYFMGRLSRLRVCALTAGDVEIPSDYAGVVFIPLDPGGAWRLLLVREMKEAGLVVDANKAI